MQTDATNYNDHCIICLTGYIISKLVKFKYLLIFFQISLWDRTNGKYFYYVFMQLCIEQLLYRIKLWLYTLCGCTGRALVWYSEGRTIEALSVQ